MKRLQAKCLCGGVRIDADFETVEISACHCDTCRRWAGGPFMVVDGGQNVVMAGLDLISIYKSSDWGERGFCKSCGSTLFFRTSDGEHVAISAMAFEDLGAAKMTSQIFIDSKPAWYSLAERTKTMTGGEFLAQFVSDEDRANG